MTARGVIRSSLWLWLDYHIKFLRSFFCVCVRANTSAALLHGGKPPDVTNTVLVTSGSRNRLYCRMRRKL